MTALKWSRVFLSMHMLGAAGCYKHDQVDSSVGQLQLDQVEEQAEDFGKQRECR